jgi:membrane protein implicated in regulation of membrane protease activity
VFSNLTMAILLLLAAVTIYFIELFVPSAGALFITGTACVIASLIYAFWVGPGTGVMFLILVTALAAILPGLFISIWRRTPIGRRMFLPPPEPEPIPVATASALSPAGSVASAAPIPPRPPAPPPPERVELVNRIGRALTPLRPAGAIEIDGRRYDVLTEGTMINRDETVRVVSVTPTEIVVRWHDPKAPEPPRRPKPAAPAAPPPELMAEVSKGLEAISDIELDRPKPARPTPAAVMNEVVANLEDSGLAVAARPQPVTPPNPPAASVDGLNSASPTSAAPQAAPADATPPSGSSSAPGSDSDRPAERASDAKPDPERDRLEDLNRRLENWSLDDEPKR